MERRLFLRDAVQIGAGLSVVGPLSNGASAQSQHGLIFGATNKERRPDPPSAVSATPTLSLDGHWLIARDPKNVGRSERWFASELYQEVTGRVPGVIQEAFPAYHGVAWYSRHFVSLPNPYPGGRYLLQFQAVDYLADVWLNGVYVGGHEGGETPFTLDITGAVKSTSDNLLVVRVLNPTNDPIDGIVLNETPRLCKVTPYWNGNLYDYGGIIGSVELVTAPALRIEDILVRPNWKTGEIRIQTTVRNARQETLPCSLQFEVAPASGGYCLSAARLTHTATSSTSSVETSLQVESPRLWSPEDPFLYRVTVRLNDLQHDSSNETSARCGFRDLRVENSYFHLNGKRTFIRSVVTLSHCPVGQRMPPSQVPDILRRDLIYAKQAGFNLIRIVGIPYPYQLDLCDEIGLMVHESSSASWKLDDSSKMKERYDRSTREMIVRDRNHPSVVIWEMLNETDDGPVFRHAVDTLSLVRSLDDTRLVMLSSGRFDCDPSIGSVSNPESSEWEHVWGKEASGAPRLPQWNLGGYPSSLGSGDFHMYPGAPPSLESKRTIRTLGHDSKPVFLSEFGSGSLIDAIHETKMYEQIGVPPNLEDYLLMRSMAERLEVDWARFSMESVYPFPEDMLREAQLRMATYRRLDFDLVRSNPRLCGYSVTGLVDEGLTGAGLWRFWRDWKPGVMDTVRDGWAPLRWCLFAQPTHGYLRRKFTVEAVLANEDVLPTGEYPAQFRICGPEGIAWEQAAIVRIPAGNSGDGPLAVPVLLEDVTIDGPAGSYEFVANLERGGAPAGRSIRFFLSDSTVSPKSNPALTLWGIEPKVEGWLRSRGFACTQFEERAQGRREIIVVGHLSKEKSEVNSWTNLARRMARGSAVIFLDPAVFVRDENPVGWLPLGLKGRCYRFGDVSIFHKECLAKDHPVFNGLQSKGILDWDYYGPMIPHYLFDGLIVPPDDVAAVAFAVGYCPDGYASGVLCGSYRCSVRADSVAPIGAGMFVLNAFPIIENIDCHPVADRLLLNLIDYVGGSVDLPIHPLPSDFDSQLKKIGYI